MDMNDPKNMVGLGDALNEVGNANRTKLLTLAGRMPTLAALKKSPEYKAMVESAKAAPMQKSLRRK